MEQRLFDPPPELSEKQFQDVIRQALRREGWLHNHIYRTKTAKGAWRTSTTAVGFPDLLAIRPGHVLAIEMKSNVGKVEADQLVWLEGFLEAGALAWVCRPRDDWQLLARWISRPGIAPRFYGWQPSAAALTALALGPQSTTTEENEHAEG